MRTVSLLCESFRFRRSDRRFAFPAAGFPGDHRVGPELPSGVSAAPEFYSLRHQSASAVSYSGPFESNSVVTADVSAGGRVVVPRGARQRLAGQKSIEPGTV